MTVVVFRSRIQPGHAEDFQAGVDRMYALVQTMPGFLSYKVYAADDGERVSIHEWESAEHLRAWREHPEHREMQALGRERFYAEYTSYVCDSPRESRFERPQASPSREPRYEGVPD
jgi:heme-degrading monooxygenase HmoA